MKLLLGAIAYLCFVLAVVAAVFAGVSSLAWNEPQQQPVLAMSTDGRAPAPEDPIAEVGTDPNRVPVWIAPTAKYEYTPVPIEPRPKIVPAIGRDAHDARTPRTRPRPERHKAATVDAVPRISHSRRDNDPFHRD